MQDHTERPRGIQALLNKNLPHHLIKGSSAPPSYLGLTWQRPRKEAEGLRLTSVWRIEGETCRGSANQLLILRSPSGRASLERRVEQQRAERSACFEIEDVEPHGPEGDEKEERQGGILQARQLDQQEGERLICARRVFVCLELPGGEPRALLESLADAASCSQRPGRVRLVGPQQKQHLQRHTCTYF